MKVLNVCSMFYDFNFNNFIEAKDYMPLDNEEIVTYITNLVEKNESNPNIKKGFFNETSTVLQKSKELQNNGIKFIDYANFIARNIYNEILKSDKILNYNVLAILASNEEVLTTYFYLFEQKPIYVLVDGMLKKELNELSTLDMYFSVNLSTLEARLLDKKRQIEGENLQFLADDILDCSYNLSSKQTLNAVNKITKKIAKSNHIDETEALTRVKSALVEKVKENKNVKPKEIVSMVFENEDIIEEMETEIEKANIPEEVDLDINYVMKNTRVQKIKTDTGIEVTIPANYFQDDQYVDFVNKDDGMMEIVLKHIASISNK